MPVPEIIRQLVQRFEGSLNAYQSPSYKEAQLRQEFLNPFFEAMGWDVANKTLRPFMALLGDEDVGVFVNIGGFTQNAASETRTQQNRQVIQIDLQKLIEVWVGNLDNLSEETKALLPLKPIHFLAPCMCYYVVITFDFL